MSHLSKMAIEQMTVLWSSFFVSLDLLSNRFLLRSMKNIDIHSSMLKVDTTLSLMRKHVKVGYFTGKYAVKFSIVKWPTYCLADPLNIVKKESSKKSILRNSLK